jgi:hypothetical protein
MKTVELRMELPDWLFDELTRTAAKANTDLNSLILAQLFVANALELVSLKHLRICLDKWETLIGGQPSKG